MRLLKYIKYNGVLIFLVVSLLIMAVIMYNDSNIKSNNLAQKLENIENEMGYREEFSKSIVQEIIRAAFDQLGVVDYIHIHEDSDSIIYEVAYTNLTKLELKAVENTYSNYINNLSGTIQNIWLRVDVDKEIYISIVDYTNHELVLLTSGGESIVFNVYTPGEKVGTDEDWIQYFIYYYEREPASQEELLQFKQERSSIKFE